MISIIMRNDLFLKLKQHEISCEGDECVDLGEAWFRRGGQRLVSESVRDKRSLPRIKKAC